MENQHQFYYGSKIEKLEVEQRYSSQAKDEITMREAFIAHDLLKAPCSKNRLKQKRKIEE